MRGAVPRPASPSGPPAEDRIIILNVILIGRAAADEQGHSPASFPKGAGVRPRVCRGCYGQKKTQDEQNPVHLKEGMAPSVSFHENHIQSFPRHACNGTVALCLRL